MIFACLFILFGCLQTFEAAPKLVDDGQLELIILHNNDMHARFEQTSINGNKCAQKDVEADKCYGGFARVAHEVREYRKRETEGGTSVLYLNAGDTYTGTPWFQLYKENITSTFLNVLKPDAISLGNHEFDEGAEILGKFLNEINFPVLAANIKTDDEPSIHSAKNLMKSHVFEKDGHKIGVIGYLTPETKLVAVHNNVIIEEEIDAINEEANKLKADGVNIIIALGHSGLAKDKIIAAECVDVDLIIGGHSHSFMYPINATLPSNDLPVADYPLMITQKSGKKVPVLQAFAYTKYLGKVHLIFDKDGNLIEIDGTPILLDKIVPRDEDVIALLNAYRPGIVELETKVLGSTKVELSGKCRTQECNLGNLICDSMVDWYANNVNSGEFWTDASIAILQGGGIRSSIDTARNITMEDLLTIMPFGAKLEVAEITGSELMEVLEHSVHRYDNGDENGEFLQFSGLNVIYDLSQPVGKRVADVKVVCAKCVIPTLVSVNLTEKYKIIIVDFLANGGDGYKTFIGKSVFKAEVSDIDFFSAYLLKKSPVFPAIEWRIKFIEHDETEVLGMTKVKLDNNCKTQECNFGNFIADSMVDNYVQNYDKDGNWTDVSIALIQGKKITSSIPANSNITRSDINSIFESKYLQVKELTGLELKNILMYGVKNDQLLQVSGLEVKIDMNKPENQEITDLRALCTGCLFPEYETVINNRHYKVIMQKSLASGEDGFGAIYENSNTEQINEYDTNAFMSYLKKKSPIYPAVEDRIIIIEKIVSPTGEPTTSSSTTTDSTTTTTEGGSSNLVMSFTVLIFSMILSFQINL